MSRIVGAARSSIIDHRSSIRAAVFLDKDGTLVENVPYNVEPSRIRLMPGALAGLRVLHDAGYALVVITNQGGVARGRFPLEALDAVEERIAGLLAAEGLPLAGFYACPHDPAGVVPAYATRCLCRKPEPGLILRAAAERHLDVTSSWMVGDILDDVEAGRRAGCRTVLVNNGHETEWRLSDERVPDAEVGTLLEAAHVIVMAAEWSGAPHTIEAAGR